MSLNTSYEKLTSIEYSYNEKKHLALITISKMLITRGLIDETPKIIIDKLLKSLEINKDDISIYNDTKNNINYVIKFINRGIQTLKKNPDVEKFLDDYKTSYKFLIVLGTSPKVQKFLNNIQNLEMFLLSEVIVNIIDHYLQPKFKILKDDKEKLYSEYNIKNKDIPRMLVTDPIARYYNAKIGDIFEIERYSGISGYSISYRIVIAGQIV